MKNFIIIANCGAIERADLENLCGEFDGKHITELKQKIEALSSRSGLNFSLITVNEFCDLTNDEAWNPEDNWIHNVSLDTNEIIYSDDERFNVIDTLVDNDIGDIKQSLFNDDFSFLSDVLMGNGWTGYMKLSDTELQIELEEMQSQIAD